MDIANIYLHINERCNRYGGEGEGGNNYDYYCIYGRQLPYDYDYEIQLQQQLQYHSHYLPKSTYTLHYNNYHQQSAMNNHLHYVNAYNQLMYERYKQQQQYIKDTLRRQQKMNYYYKHYIAPMHRDIDTFRQRVTDDIKAVAEENERKRVDLPLIEREIKKGMCDVVDHTLQQRNNVLMGVTNRDIDDGNVDRFIKNNTVTKAVNQMNYPKEGLDNALQGITKTVDELHGRVNTRKEKVKDVSDKCTYGTIIKEHYEDKLKKMMKKKKNESIQELKQKYKRQYEYEILKDRFRNICSVEMGGGENERERE